MKEITVLAENKVGSLAAVAEALGGAGVNIEAISAYATDEHAVFRFITTDPATSVKILSRLKNVISTDENEVIIVRLINRPGELGKVTKKLMKYQINLESLYIVSKENDYTDVAIRPSSEQYDKAKEVLGAD